MRIACGVACVGACLVARARLLFGGRTRSARIPFRLGLTTACLLVCAHRCSGPAPLCMCHGGLGRPLARRCVDNGAVGWSVVVADVRFRLRNGAQARCIMGTAWAAASDTTSAPASVGGIAVRGAVERTLLVRREGDAGWAKVVVSSAMDVPDLTKAIVKEFPSLKDADLSTLTLHLFDPATSQVGKDALDVTRTVAEALPSSGSDRAFVVIRATGSTLPPSSATDGTFALLRGS